MSFRLDEISRIIPGIRSRSITAENPTGAKGGGGSASSPLGPGRKGSPAFSIRAGQTLTLADIDGPGIIRHIWMTVPDRTDAGPYVLRDLVLRAYWDDAESPAIEVPLGDFFCCGFGTRALVNSLPMVVAPTGGMNCYLPMPFRRHVLVTLTNEHPVDVGGVFTQIDYTAGDDISEDTGYLCAQWRRSNASLAEGTDHVVIDNVRGPGAYIGTYIALTALERFWWGEGEVKFYIDGDTNLPTICGTGLEDYVGGAWGFQDHLGATPTPTVHPFSAPFSGYPHYSHSDDSEYSPYARPMPPGHGMYRWHVPDPVYFSDDLRVTVQQIGDCGHGLFERSDDISTTAYWYQQSAVLPFPALPSAGSRRPR